MARLEGNGRLSFINYLDDPDTVITASKELSGMPAINVGNRLAFLKMRALLDGDPVVYVDCDFQTSQSMQSFGVRFPRRTTPEALYDKTPAGFGPNDTIQILLSDIALGDFEIWDSGALPSNVIRHNGNWALWLDAPKVARYMRIVFSTPSRVSIGAKYPVPYLDISRIWAGPDFYPKHGMNYGVGLKLISGTSKQQPQRGTTIFTASKNSRQQWSFTFGWLDDVTELPELRKFLAYITDSGEFLFHRHDLPEGEQNIFAINGDVYPIVGDNYGKSSWSVLFDENV